MLAAAARLLVAPEREWERRSAAPADGTSMPALGAVLVSLPGVFATFIGVLVDPQRSAGVAATHGLIVLASHAGTIAAVVWAAPRLVDDDRAAELTATALVPLALSGVLNVLPIGLWQLLAAIAGAAFSARAAYVGASMFLGLEGERRKSAAAVVTIAATGPLLGLTLLRWILF